MDFRWGGWCISLNGLLLLLLLLLILSLFVTTAMGKGAIGKILLVWLYEYMYCTREEKIACFFKQSSLSGQKESEGKQLFSNIPYTSLC